MQCLRNPLVLLILIGIAWSGTIYAEPATPGAPFAGLGQPHQPTAAAANTSDAPCIGYADEARKACEAWQVNTFRHEIWSRDYRERAYNAHHYYTMLVFCLVCALVLLGMYLSYREFLRDERKNRSPRPKSRSVSPENRRSADASTDETRHEGPVAQDQATEFQVGASGIKVSSRVLGVLVLSVSMGFFYLYLATVYPIQEGADKVGTAAVRVPAEGGQN